jgi:hypothetical protein
MGVHGSLLGFVDGINLLINLLLLETKQQQIWPLQSC